MQNEGREGIWLLLVWLMSGHAGKYAVFPARIIKPIVINGYIDV
jgi:hypothetical protein